MRMSTKADVCRHTADIINHGHQSYEVPVVSAWMNSIQWIVLTMEIFMQSLRLVGDTSALRSNQNPPSTGITAGNFWSVA